MKRITASEMVGSIIEEGAKVDTEIKNLTYKDKVLKARLTDEVKGLFEGDTSVRLTAETAAAVITAVEKVELDESKGEFIAVSDAVKKGMLGGVVERELKLAIPAVDVERAEKILEAAGIKASVKEDWTVKADGYREFTTSKHVSAEADKLAKALGTVAVKTATYRVKYEKA